MSGYIGSIPVPQATQTRQSFTATASQTTFNTAGYSPGYVDVFLNGVKLAPADYTATNGSDIVLATGAAASDILEIVAYEIFQVADQDFTGDFSVDTDTLFVDSTNDRVGIGTSSPSVTLDARLGTTTGKIAELHNSVGYGIGFTIESDGGVNTINAESNQALAFATNGASNERMRITSDGSVGIGTSSPSTKLDIIGSSTNGSGVVDTLRLRNTGTTINDGPRLQFTAGTSTSGAAIASQGKALNSADLLFYAGGNTERMRIDTSGQIGVSGSTASFDTTGAVNGLQLYYETDAGVATVGSYSSGGSTALTFHTNSSGGASSEAMRIKSDGNLQINGQLHFTDTGSLIARPTTNALSFNTNGSERMRIDSSGDVGIGTSGSTPSRFAVRLSGNNDGNVSGWSDALATFHIGGNGTTSQALGISGSTTTNYMYVTSLAPNVAWKNLAFRATKHDFLIENGSSHKVRVDVDGLKFNGDTSADNALDDYEEGTWTPNFVKDGGATITYGGQTGAYTKVGRMVNISGRIQTNTFSGGSGQIRIGNLPFTAGSHGSDLFAATLSVVFGGWSSTNAPTAGFISPSTTEIKLYAFDSADARNQRDTTVTSSGDGSVGLIFSCTYFV